MSEPGSEGYAASKGGIYSLTQDGWFLYSMFVSYTDVYLVEIDHFLGHPTVNRNILAINEIVFLLTEK